MKILCVLFILSCLFDLFSPCNARRKRPAYLTAIPEGEYRNKKAPLVSPFIQKITKKNKSLAKRLHKLELQGQKEIAHSEKQAKRLKKEFAREQAHLEKENKLQIAKLQEQHQKMMKRFQKQLNKNLHDRIRKLSKQTNRKLVKLKKVAKKKEEKLVVKAKQETLRKINQAEMRLIENYLGKPKVVLAQNDPAPSIPKPRPLAPSASRSEVYRGAQNQLLDSWKKTKQKELDETIAYLEPILSSDEELAQMLANKKMTIATNITDTQKIEDESYTAVMNDLKPLLITHKTQKAADEIVDEQLATMDISNKNRQDIRFIILAELQPHIQQAVATEQEISSEKLQNLVTIAVAEVQKKPTPAVAIDDTLRTQLAMLEEKLRAQQLKFEIQTVRNEQEKQHQIEKLTNIQEKKTKTHQLKQAICTKQQELCQEKNSNLHKQVQEKTAQLANLSSEVNKLTSQARNQIVEIHKQRIKSKLANYRSANVAGID